MKKIWWFGVMLVLVVASLIPYRQQEHLLIKKRYENVYSLLLKPELWYKWHPQVKTAWLKDSASIKIERQNLNFKITTPEVKMSVKNNGFGFDVDKEFASHLSLYSFTILPYTNTRYTDVQLITVSSVFKNLERLLRHASPINDLNSLKQFIEDDRAYYGYDIQTQAAVDTNIIVEQRTVPVSSRDITIRSIQQDLQKFVEKNGLKITQPVMADIRVLYPDSVRIMVGLSVNKAVKPVGPIHIMNISKQARVLTITYKGKYGKRQAVYNILKKYMHDHDLLVPEIPYEKYLNNKIPLGDNDEVHMQVIAPLQ